MALSKRVIWSIGELMNEKEINDLDVSVSEAGIDEADKGIFFYITTSVLRRFDVNKQECFYFLFYHITYFHVSSYENRREMYIY